MGMLPMLGPQLGLTDAQKDQLADVLRWAVSRGMTATFHWHNDRAAHHLLGVLERVNARTLDRAVIDGPVHALVCDASFIGLRTVLPAGLALCEPDAWAVALIKPQFEAGRGAVGSKGVVRDPAVHARVCDDVVAWWRAMAGWSVLGVEPSPITGPPGYREFLIAARRG